MSLEWWKSFFEIGGVILILLTFAFGAGALIVNNRLGAIQDAQLRQFDKDLTDEKGALADAKTEMAVQQERAATAEKALLELQQKIKWRSVSPEQRKEFLAAVSNIKKGSVVITVAGGDAEAISFANELRSLLKEGKYSVPPVDVVPLLYPEFSVGLHLVIQSLKPLKEVPTDPQRVEVPDDSPIAHGLPLGTALDAARFLIPKERLSRAHAKDEVTLLVGTKP
jgi:hypothetical protein